MRLRTILLCSLPLVLVGCGMLSPAQQQTALDTINEMLSQGTISREQHAVLTDGILQQGWSGFLEQLTGFALAAVAAYTGVMIRRGPPTRTENLAKKAEAVFQTVQHPPAS
jgi:uncharacterized protein YoaH (UPF0181 family)